jgi:hypothetical protein
LSSRIFQLFGRGEDIKNSAYLNKICVKNFENTTEILHEINPKLIKTPKRRKMKAKGLLKSFTFSKRKKMVTKTKMPIVYKLPDNEVQQEKSQARTLLGVIERPGKDNRYVKGHQWGHHVAVSCLPPFIKFVEDGSTLDLNRFVYNRIFCLVRLSNKLRWSYPAYPKRRTVV